MVTTKDPAAPRAIHDGGSLLDSENRGFEPEFLKVVERLEREDIADRELRARGEEGYNPEEGYWALAPATARLLHVLIQTIVPSRMLEVGVSHGYSTVWLAHAARLTGGHLTALEYNPRVLEIARQNLAEAGLTDQVDFVLGDARETLTTIGDEYDFMFLDCWDRLYPEILPKAVPLLRPGGLMTTDNVDVDEPGSIEFRRLLSAYAGIETTNVPIGTGGLEVTTRRQD